MFALFSEKQMNPKTYQVVLKCGILMTSSTIEVVADSEREARDITKMTSPSSFIVQVQEMESV